MVHETKRTGTSVLRVVVVLVTVVTLSWTLRDAEPQRVVALLEGVGGAGVLILLPQLLALLAESIGWRLAFEGMGQKFPLSGLFRARIATEALAQTLPMGVVFCESMKPLLLARTCGAELSTSLAGMAARKWLLAGSQSLYVGGFALLAWPALTGISLAVVGVAGLPYALLAAAGLLLLLAAGIYVFLAHGQVASRAHVLLTRLPSAWLKARLAPLASKFTHTDAQLRAFFSTAFHSPFPLLAFLTCWLLEAADTFLILYLLGVQLPWTTVGAIEVSASFLRSLAFMVPAGLGVQDLCYLAFLRALSVADALNVAAAFLLLKRSKECFWAVCGYIILVLELRAMPARNALEQAC